jgi:hypothetical protein
VGAARNTALKMGHNTIMGHLHSIDRAPVPHWPEGITGRIIGCCCRLDMDYNGAHVETLRQQNGFVYGEKKNGKLIVRQAEKAGGDWLLPTEVRHRKGK